MATDFSRINASVLRMSGQSFTLTRIDTGISSSFSGILESGLEAEDSSPGEGSVNARCWTSLAELVTLPSKGDEITTQSTVYTIIDLAVDAADGVTLKLRKARAA